MPTYVYYCERKHQILDERGMNDKPTYEKCPACNTQLSRDFSGVSQTSERIGDWT